MKLAFLLLSLCFGSLSLLSTQLTQANETSATSLSVIAVGAGVKVHAEPKTTSKEVARLQIGTVVKVLQKTAQTEFLENTQDYWYKVSLAEDKQGWIFGSFIAPIDNTQLIDKYIKIAESQLKVDPPIFSNLVDTVNFLNRVIAQLPASEQLGELKLLKFLTVERSLTVIAHQDEKQSPYKEWLKEQASAIVYNEMMSGWMLNAEVLWKLAAEYRGVAMGDKIAWAAANAGIGGECELDMSCNVGRLNLTLAKYLALYPAGEQVEASLIHLLDEAKNLQVLLREQSAPLNAESKNDLRQQIKEFKRLLAAVDHPLKARVFAQMDKAAE